MKDMSFFITRLAKDAGKIALGYFGKAEVSSKGVNDVVTEADLKVEKFIITAIKSNFPDHNIVAEESTNKFDPSKPTWYIDPIDGTINYSRQDPHFAVSVACYSKDKKYACVYLPMLKELFYAETGKGTTLNGKKISVSEVKRLKDGLIHLGVSPLKESIDDSLAVFRFFNLNAWRARDFGFSAGQLAYVACSRADGFVKLSQHPWDIAAGMVLIEEAGGKVTDEKGDKLVLGDAKACHNIVCSNSRIHDDLINVLNTDLKSIDKSKKWW